MELKLTKEGTEYLLGLPIEDVLFSWVIDYKEKEKPIDCYVSLEEAKKARDELAKQLGKPLAIYERVTRRLD